MFNIDTYQQSTYCAFSVIVYLAAYLKNESDACTRILHLSTTWKISCFTLFSIPLNINQEVCFAVYSGPSRARELQLLCY